ncbi:MAG: nucleotidyltransferase family protein, partial [Dermatophilaceae bacterium]
MVDDEELRKLGQRLCEVHGVVGVLLGGSRARGEHTPESDFDLGLCYRPPLDIDALQDLARDVAGAEASVTRPRSGDRGSTAAVGCTSAGSRWTGPTATSTASTGLGTTPEQAGTTSMSRSGIRWACRTSCMSVRSPSASSWPTRRVRLQRCSRLRHYPPRLRDALVAGLWEASFAIDNARKAVTRADTTYMAGCLFRAVEVCAHALHGHAGHWLINEKGAVASAGRLPEAPA